MVFITYVIPWLAAEPKDAFEDVGSVKIIGASQNFDEAKEIATEYVQDNSGDGTDDVFIVVDDEETDDTDDTDDIVQTIYVSFTPIPEEPSSVRFNDINGYAVVIKSF